MVVADLNASGSAYLHRRPTCHSVYPGPQALCYVLGSDSPGGDTQLLGSVRRLVGLLLSPGSPPVQVEQVTRRTGDRECKNEGKEKRMR